MRDSVFLELTLVPKVFKSYFSLTHVPHNMPRVKFKHPLMKVLFMDRIIIDNFKTTIDRKYQR